MYVSHCMHLFFILTTPHSCQLIFFFNDTATTEIYTLSLHDALPILTRDFAAYSSGTLALDLRSSDGTAVESLRSEEHTSELQSRLHLVCRLLLEKKKNKKVIVLMSSVMSVIICEL